MSENVYYVYLHRRKDNNEVFYVGKGKNKRANNVHGRSVCWQNYYNKYGRIVEFVEKCLSEDDAFDLEKETIDFYKNCGQAKANLAAGGQGTSGGLRSDQQKQYLSYVNDKVILINDLGTVFVGLKAAADWVRLTCRTKAKDPRSVIHNCCIGRSDYSYGRRWRFVINGEIDQSNHAKSIFDGEHKNKISCSNGMLFETPKCAVAWLEDNGHGKSCINSVLCAVSGKGGYKYRDLIWKYVVQYVPPKFKCYEELIEEMGTQFYLNPVLCQNRFGQIITISQHDVLEVFV